ncbi:MAG: hypothetical protein ACXVFC_08050, partial [Gaiellaceae bacterium]
GIALIGLVVVIQHRSHTTVKVGAAPGTISWKLGAGKTVTPDEYGSVEKGARLAAVRKRFGEPATTEPNPLDEASGATQTCLGYRSSASDSTLFLFCFAGGRLIDKQIF